MGLREMVKFFTGRRDDGEGPSNNPSRKRQRTSADAEEEEEEEREPQHVEDTSGTVNEEEDNDEVEDEEHDEDDVEDEGGDAQLGREEDRAADGGGNAELGREEDHAADEAEHYQLDETIDVGLSLNLNGIGMTCGSAFDARGGSATAVNFRNIDKALDCFICCEPLSIPVYQCCNGHYACSTCCVKLGNKCALCSMSIGYIRCRGLEITLESIQLPCLNAKYGCGEALSYWEKNEHEKNCIYVPCLCPHLGCDFAGMYKLVSRHFFIQHSDCTKNFLYEELLTVILRFDERIVFLQEQTDTNLFILTKNFELAGHLLHIDFIGPNSSNPWFHCFMAATNQQGWSVSTQFPPKHIQESIVGSPSSGYLLLPFGFLGSSQQHFKLDIIIKRNVH